MKIKWGALVVDGSGKIGGHVASKNKSGSYLRTKVSPTNPQTSFQSSVRSQFAAISSGWSNLTDAQRISFADKVGDYAKTNIFGDLKNPTAKALYQRLNQNLSLTGQALISVCPSPEIIPSGLISGAVLTMGADYLLDLSGDSTGSKIMILATPIVSNGTNFVKNKFRVIDVQAGALNNEIDLTLSYENRFGGLLNGDVVFLGVKFVNANGQASPMQTIKVITTGV